jgi:probable rRNA maturation factor
VSVIDGRGRPLRDGGLARWLERVAPSGARGAVAVALVGDAHVRSLNRRYRHKDSVTDVLSFPADDALTSPAGGRVPRRKGGPAARDLRSVDGGGPAILGDIVIATGVATRQAKEAGHSPQTELRVLALHGLLHLLGYDHEAARDAGRMARLERRLRRKGGLEGGLIERASSRRNRS